MEVLEVSQLDSSMLYHRRYLCGKTIRKDNTGGQPAGWQYHLSMRKPLQANEKEQGIVEQRKRPGDFGLLNNYLIF